MKKKDFSKLALKGLTAGLLLSTPAIQAAQSAGSSVAQGCGAGGQSSQGYGVQGGNSCSAGQPSQGYYQGQPNQNYNQGHSCSAGQPSQGYYQGQPNQNNNQGQQTQNMRMQNQNNRQQNPSQLSSGCGGKGKCSGVIAIGDAPTKIDNQKDYDSSYESSYENQNKNDSMMPSDRNNSQGKYLADSQMTTAQKPMTEADLMKKLDAQGKATYNTLSPKGKAMALSMANEDNGKRYSDKNAVVKMAADKTASEKKWGN